MTEKTPAERLISAANLVTIVTVIITAIVAFNLYQSSRTEKLLSGQQDRTLSELANVHEELKQQSRLVAGLEERSKQLGERLNTLQDIVQAQSKTIALLESELEKQGRP